MQLSFRFRYLVILAHFKMFPSIPYKEALEAYEVIGCQFAAASCDTNSNTLDTTDYVLWCSIVVYVY